jgi:hypothetical protein
MVKGESKMMNGFSTQSAIGGAITLLVAGVLCGTAMHLEPVLAAPPTCAAIPSAASPSTSSGATPPSSLPAAAIPTEAAIAPEVNPPGDIPDNQAFVTYTSQNGGYSLSVPEGWARKESGADVSFQDKLHRFTVEVVCAAAAPTVESAKATGAAQLAQRISAFELVDVTSVDLPAGPAILIRYRTNSAPDDVTGKQIRLDVDRYEIFKDSRIAIVSLSGPAGSDNVDVSNQVSRSFRWTA